MLVHYFPNQQNALDQQFSASLTAIQASADVKAAGVDVGEASADALIAARTGDGIAASVPYLPGSGPGMWEPTPPGFLAPATPWLGQMRPFTMRSPRSSAGRHYLTQQLRVGTRLYRYPHLGAANSTARTPKQTEIGIFWTENTAQQYARLFTNLASQNHLSVPHTARFMAILWTGFADAGIGCFNAKYHYGFWRPVTAIPAGGGDPDLTGDASWLPLGTTPNHPEYPAAHACITSAGSQLIAGYFGTPKVHIVVDSLSFKDGTHTHTFGDTRDFFDEAFWARVYAGFHYYHSLVDGGEGGSRTPEQIFPIGR